MSKLGAAGAAVEIETRDSRKDVRFDIKDSHMWSFSYNGKSLPVKWFKDISSTGVKICQAKLGSLDVGEMIDVKVILLADTVIQRSAIVKWKKLSDSSVNLCELGLEFDTPINEQEFNPNTVSRKFLQQKTDLRESTSIQKPFVDIDFVKCAALAIALSFFSGLALSIWTDLQFFTFLRM